MYPGSCGDLQPFADLLINFQSCTRNTQILVAVWEYDDTFGVSAREFADNLLEEWRTDSYYKLPWRNSVETHQGLWLELIRFESDYGDGTPSTGVAAFYTHDDALFLMRLHYATKYKTENAPIVDFTLKSFTVLE